MGQLRAKSVIEWAGKGQWGGRGHMAKRGEGIDDRATHGQREGPDDEGGRTDE